MLLQNLCYFTNICFSTALFYEPTVVIDKLSRTPQGRYLRPEPTNMNVTKKVPPSNLGGSGGRWR